MEKNKCQIALERVIDICFEEECEELAKEIMSVQNSIEDDQNDRYYLSLIEDILNIVPIYEEEFSLDISQEIEEVYREVVDL